MVKLPLHEVISEVHAGKPLNLGDKTVYLIFRISVMQVDGKNIAGCQTMPLSMLVIEPGRAYPVTISEDLSLKEIQELAPELRETVDKALGIHRIKVT